MRLSMRKTYEILRLKLSLGLSHRDVATRLGVSTGVVSKVVNRAEKASLTWPMIEPLSEDELDVRLNGPRLPTTRKRPVLRLAERGGNLAEVRQLLGLSSQMGVPERDNTTPAGGD